MIQKAKEKKASLMNNTRPEVRETINKVEVMETQLY
jgi:hypothetical protein